MKHFIRLVLVVALFAGVACADYLAIEPVAPIAVTPADIGTQYTAELNWYHDTSPEYVVGFEFMIGIDLSELAFVLPADPPGPSGPAYNGDMGKVSFEMVGDDLHVWNLQADFYEAGSSPTTLISDLVVELTGMGPADGSDVWVKDQAGTNQGIARYLPPDYAVIGTTQYGRGEGMDMNGVPEPATTALLGIGLLGALLRKRS